MPRPAAAWTAETWRLLLLTLAASLGVNAVLLAIDHEPLFVVGDSMVYVQSALAGAPSDRSFTYGHFLIRPLLWLFGSLNAVVVAQSVLSALCATMLAAVLRVGFGAAPILCAVVGLAYAAEPLAIFYQHMMMTEAAALFWFALFLTIAVAYVVRPRLWLLVALGVASTAAVSLRTSFVPVLLVVTAMLPPLAILRPGFRTRPMLTRCAIHLGVALAVSFAMHGGYKLLFHRITGEPPAYNAADGVFTLASWAPLLTRADFPDPALYDRIRPTLGTDIANRFTRPAQRFSPDGLITRLVETQGGNERQANTLARQVAMNILRRDPLGVLALGWRTYLDFWNPRVMTDVIAVDEGLKEADQPLIDKFRTLYGEDIAGHQKLRGYVKAWHAAASGWYRFVLLTPLVWLVSLAVRPRYWRVSLLLGASVVGLLLVDCLLVTEPVVRYLHSIAWLTVLFCGVIAGALLAWLRGWLWQPRPHPPIAGAMGPSLSRDAGEG